MAFLAVAWAGSVHGGGVDFAWVVEDGVLTGEASAATAGWVCVGFGARPGLAGSVLVMGAHGPQGSVVEEHVAQPPRHPRRVDLGEPPGLLEGRAEERDGRTTVRFRWALDPALRVGEPVYLTLAWSHEDDFDHHSARRVEVEAVL
ncbi:MAG: hypothetical protein H6737_14595 [Alphaproteobacteria bacterium]|nr:hypothetical protein [Alphaproteobacteria bacterium]